jgi:hypothetical protein
VQIGRLAAQIRDHLHRRAQRRVAKLRAVILDQGLKARFDGHRNLLITR